MVETIRLEHPIFCSWVEQEVDESLLGKQCAEYINNGRCTKCGRSQQLDYGVHIDKLLENLRSCQ